MCNGVRAAMMNVKLQVANSTDNHFNDPTNIWHKLWVKLSSLLNILIITTLIGLVSFASISVVNEYLKLSVSEDLWCVLAICLAVVYFFIKKLKH